MFDKDIAKLEIAQHINNDVWRGRGEVREGKGKGRERGERGREEKGEKRIKKIGRVKERIEGKHTHACAHTHTHTQH